MLNSCVQVAGLQFLEFGFKFVLVYIPTAQTGTSARMIGAHIKPISPRPGPMKKAKLFWKLHALEFTPFILQSNIELICENEYILLF